MKNILLLCERQTLFQVGARAEGSIAFAGQDQGARAASAGLGVESVDHPTQLGQELVGEGIASLGSVQGQDGDDAGVRGGDATDLDGGGQRGAVPHTTTTTTAGTNPQPLAYETLSTGWTSRHRQHLVMMDIVRSSYNLHVNFQSPM